MTAKAACPRCLAEARKPGGDPLSVHTASARCGITTPGQLTSPSAERLGLGVVDTEWPTEERGYASKVILTDRSR